MADARIPGNSYRQSCKCTYGTIHTAPKGEGGELRRCSNCGTWWKHNPEFRYQWSKVMPWHLNSMRAIAKFEKSERMLVLVNGNGEND